MEKGKGMTWKDQMNDALSAYASTRLGREVRVDELRYDGGREVGGCDTCGYGSTTDNTIEFYNEGRWVMDFDGDWTDLMNALND